MDHDSDERGETEPVRRKTRIFKNPQSLGEAVRNPLCVLLLLIVIMADAFVAAFAGLYGGALSRRAILFFNPHWRGHMLPHAPEALHTRGSHDWASNVLRGERLVKLMKAKDVLDTDKTTWTSYGDIERYGWTMKAESIDEEEKKVSQSVLKALTIKQLDNTAKPADVDKKKTMGHEVEYPATNAFYRNFYNCDRGIVVASNLKSPQHTEIGGLLDPEKLVPLQHWSDVTFITWEELCGAQQKPIGGLKYILHMNVIAEDIEEVVKHVTGIEAGRFSEAYPGMAVQNVPESEGAHGTIGSMAMTGDAYLLIQHKDVFGGTRTFKSVQVWDANDGQRSGVAGDANIPNVLVTLS
ncbi:uncharacterized protein CLAFUR5_05153 [Fulvia fulva]|uniref:Uncharacterized protein n=1 Tax=Passalora fulva TaxID=5499 RepID=A0A9Q8LGA8_PASFU|nr:uncharacterized protein CLAFUR5_05153 [Fulvia fulva]KAK4616624.1 hypothetical protein CLAFUR0_10547 [Fulvia fulva]KAK4617133.1 hypothetical protein CLAFUR0_10700 [Fulvia fulva]UJO16863.1 hypothetical protein CLAFUR5_05153 [Fulvia fulva]